MPHDSDRTHLPRPAIAILTLLLGLPLTAQAQGRATVQAQATVLSAEGTRAWQSVARRLQTPGDSGVRTAPPEADLLATVTEVPGAADGAALPARRTITVEFLSN